MGVLLLLLYSAITLPLFVIDTARIAATPFAISPDFFIAARSAVVESLLEQSRVYSSRIVSSAPLLAIFGCFVTLIEERSRWIRWGALLIAACLGILTTGRVALLLFFSGWLTISLLERSDRSIVSVGRRLAYVVLAVALVFTLLTFLSKSETQGKGKIAVASELTIAYIAGPIAAFDYAVRNGNLFSGQMNNTFSDVMGPVLPAFGISYHPPPIVEPFVSVPIPVNVYTAFKPFNVDFGAFGCLVAFGTFGFIHGVLFRAASRGFRPAVFLLAGISYALIFTPFTDAYHHLFHYVYLIIYCALYFLGLAKLPDFTLSIKRLRTPLTVENC
jgi:oligosaccharide repeat unit polymerase